MMQYFNHLNQNMITASG